MEAGPAGQLCICSSGYAKISWSRICVCVCLCVCRDWDPFSADCDLYRQHGVQSLKSQQPLNCPLLLVLTPHLLAHRSSRLCRRAVTVRLSHPPTIQPRYQDPQAVEALLAAAETASAEPRDRKGTLRLAKTMNTTYFFRVLNRIVF